MKHSVVVLAAVLAAEVSLAEAKGLAAACVENNDDVVFKNCSFLTEGVDKPQRIVNSTSVRVVPKFQGF